MNWILDGLKGLFDVKINMPITMILALFGKVEHHHHIHHHYGDTAVAPQTEQPPVAIGSEEESNSAPVPVSIATEEP